MLLLNNTVLYAVIVTISISVHPLPIHIDLYLSLLCRCFLIRQEENYKQKCIYICFYIYLCTFTGPFLPPLVLFLHVPRVLLFQPEDPVQQFLEDRVLVTSFPNFSGVVLISPLFLRDSFAIYRLLGGQVCSFSTWKRSSHCLLTSVVSNVKYVFLLGSLTCDESLLSRCFQESFFGFQQFMMRLSGDLFQFILLGIL